MKKDIYIIKNDINKKVYIGQAVNTQNRWWYHLSDARKSKKYSIIDKAINKYGKEHFHYEIIESQIENYNEREQYWIKQYNSRVPNGYNIAIGGKGVGNGVNSLTASIKDEEILESLIDTIIQTDWSLTKIAEIYSVNPSTVIEINNGTAYYSENLNYPLRECRLSEEKFKQLVYSLKYEYDKNFDDLSKEYSLDKSCISEINQGISYHKDWLTYPLRKGKTKNPFMAVGKRIRFFRRLRSMTQKELGKAVGFSSRTASVRIAQYEIGARTPKLELLKQISDALNISADALTTPDLENVTCLMHTLFALEDSRFFNVLSLAGNIELSGASIKNIAVNAAFIAASRREITGMGHIMEALQQEYEKSGKILGKAELKEYYVYKI